MVTEVGNVIESIVCDHKYENVFSSYAVHSLESQVDVGSVTDDFLTKVWF